MLVKALMERGMFALMGLPTCKQVEEFAYDFLEGALDAKTARKLERHLKACKNCRRFMVAYRKARDLEASAPRPPLDPQFKEEILKFLIKEGMK